MRDDFLDVLAVGTCYSSKRHIAVPNAHLASFTQQTLDHLDLGTFAQVTVTHDLAAYAGEATVSDNTTGAYRLNTTSGNKTPRQPVNGQGTVEPAFFLTGEGPRDGETRRAAYARMLTAHPQFARAAVNYLWKELFGLAIVEPADSFDLLRQRCSHVNSSSTGLEAFGLAM